MDHRFSHFTNRTPPRDVIDKVAESVVTATPTHKQISKLNVIERKTSLIKNISSTPTFNRNKEEKRRLKAAPPTRCCPNFCKQWRLKCNIQTSIPSVTSNITMLHHFVYS